MNRVLFDILDESHTWANNDDFVVNFPPNTPPKIDLIDLLN